MYIYGCKKILLRISALMLLMMGLFFSGFVKAQEMSVADVDSAYEYYNNVASGSSKNQQTTTTTRTTVSSGTQNTTTNNSTGLGSVAANLMEPVEIVAGFLSGASIIVGMTCLFAGFVRYMQHRVNPLAHPISTVITLVILGILLLLLPLIYKFTESGIPFSLG